MAIAFGRDDASAGRAAEKTNLDEVGFDHVFDRVHFFAGDRGNGLESGGPTFEFIDDSLEDDAISGLQSQPINFKQGQGLTGDFATDDAIVMYFGIVPDAFQDAVGDAGRAATGPSNFTRAEFVERDAEDTGRTPDNSFDFVSRVELKPVNGTEAIAKGIGERPEPGRRADKGETGEIELDSAGRWAFADDDVEFVIFHRWVEHLLNGFVQPVDLIDEEHIAWFEVGEDAPEIPDAFDSGTTRHLDPGAHFPGDDVSQGGLAEAGWSIEEHVIDGLTALFRGLDKNFKITLRLFLTDILGKGLRSERVFNHNVFFSVGGGVEHNSSE